MPQESDLSQDLYNIVIADIPNADNILISTYADDTALLMEYRDNTVSSSNHILYK